MSSKVNELHSLNRLLAHILTTYDVTCDFDIVLLEANLRLITGFMYVVFEEYGDDIGCRKLLNDQQNDQKPDLTSLSDMQYLVNTMLRRGYHLGSLVQVIRDVLAQIELTVSLTRGVLIL